MKILCVYGISNPSISAGWARIGFFAGSWSKKGHLVDVLGAFSYKSLHESGVREAGELNIFHLIFKMDLNHPLIFMLNSFLSFMFSMVFLTARRPNVAMISVPSGDVGLGVLIACKLTRVKCIVDYRDEWEDYTMGLSKSKVWRLFYFEVKKLMANLYAKSKLVVVVTSNSLASLRRRGITNITVVQNGADVKTFKPLSKSIGDKGFTVFYSGSIGGYYRLDVALKSIRKLLDNGLNNIRLVFVGDGEVYDVLNMAFGLGISSNIQYKGIIRDKARLSKLIAEASVGLIPYDDNPLWKNALPAKFFEYCACGIPVIATVYGDAILAKLIKEHEVGLTVPPMDEERLAEAIHKIYRNKSYRETAGKRARALVEERFDRNKTANMLLNLIEEVARAQTKCV